MDSHPYSFEIRLPIARPDRHTRHITRHLSWMRDQFLSGQAVAELIEQGDPLLYEVFELSRPEVAGELIQGISIVHPGRVGDEYFMTKGHFHTVIETGEVYYCLEGEGMMVMETPEGDWAVEPLRPGRVVYVPPRWAHRSVNTGNSTALATFFSYPGNAGHDYGTIERQGFRKLVVSRNGVPEVTDNPRWRPPQTGGKGDF